MRILITSFRFDTRTGVEVYVRDLALGLHKRGHTPIIYSPQLGELAVEIRALGIQVTDDLTQVKEPEIIHGQHHLETVEALLNFPGVPAVYFSHSPVHWADGPPRFPRILQCVAVDQDCYDKLISEHRVPPERVTVQLNFVDLERFQIRSPLPAKPRRALLYSSYSEDDAYLSAVRKACAATGLTLDVVGLGVGNSERRPESLLSKYDIVFAKARSALEALAVGTAVVVYCLKSAGPMVTASEVDRLLPLNFGFQTMKHRLTPAALTQKLIEEIRRYDPVDAAQASIRVRAVASQEKAFDAIVSLYQRVVKEYESTGGPQTDEEERSATAAYVRWLSNHYVEESRKANDLTVIRLKRRLVEVPFIGKLAHSVARRLAGPLS